MSTKAVYLITGGRLSSARQLTKDFGVALSASGKPSPKVAYLGAANSDNKMFFRAMKALLMKAGAVAVSMVSLAHENADADKAKRICLDADAVFLSGGEVEDGMMWLKRFGLDSFLTELFRGGKLFFGLSAGAIMTGQHWVHWDTCGDDSTSGLFSCLNLVPFVFDAHGEKEDWEELRCALQLLGPGATGHGLSSGGFYAADESGRLISFRNEPAVLRNMNGKIEMAAGTQQAHAQGNL